MRPLLFGVDADAIPPTFDVCFPGVMPGEPHRVATVRLKTVTEPETPRRLIEMAAAREFGRFTPDRLEQLRDVAKPIDPRLLHLPPDPAVVLAATVVHQDARYPGVLFCPACCHKLGRGDDPAIGYMMRCASCGRGLTVRFEPGAVIVRITTRG